MTRHLRGAALGLALVAVAGWLVRAADDAKAGARETAVSTTLTTYWDALDRLDREAFRATVDFPLTLQELKADGRLGERFVFTPASLGKLFPARPEAPERPLVKLDGLRLDFLGAELCQAVYTVVWEEDNPAPAAANAPAAHPKRTELRCSTLLVLRDGWRVAVSTLPG